jgi:hypothetical protein
LARRERLREWFVGNLDMDLLLGFLSGWRVFQARHGAFAHRADFSDLTLIQFCVYLALGSALCARSKSTNSP